MVSPSPANLPFPPRRVGRGQLLLSFGLALLLLSTVGLGGFHHHHDQTSHADCAVCAAAHHAGTVPAGPTLPDIVLHALPLLFVPLVLTVPVLRPASHLRSRAPPR